MSAALQKANDPATVGAVPGLGSTSSGEDGIMNEVTNTTAAISAPVADISDLETPIADATRMASILARLITEAIGGSSSSTCKLHLTKAQREDMLFAAYHTEDLIHAIFAKWEALV